MNLYNVAKEIEARRKTASRHEDLKYIIIGKVESNDLAKYDEAICPECGEKVEIIEIKTIDANTKTIVFECEHKIFY